MSVDGGRGGRGGVGSDDMDDDAVIAMTMMEMTMEMTTEMTTILMVGTAMAVMVEGGDGNDDFGRQADSFSAPLL